MEQREIKFRAFETNKGLGSKMSEAFTLTDIHNNSLGNFGDTFIFMQFIGLLDQTGKEIYEGDILVCCNDGFKGKIEYCKGKAAFWLYSTIERKYRELHLIGAYSDERGIFIDAHVIGNIYDPSPVESSKNK